MNQEEITGFDAIYTSGLKTRQGVSWKPTVKKFNLNNIEETIKIVDDFRNGTWKDGKPKPIQITYPKPRDGLSIPYRDRIYQRSLNDVALYPMVTRSFIFANAACQKGKGPEFTRELVRRYLWGFYRKYGLEGYLLQIDIHGYYPNMRHDVTKDTFKKHTPKMIHEMASNVLDHQYEGDVGYNPGSQMVQIAGIADLNELDHIIKEKLHHKLYIRYMDDLWILHQSRDYLVETLTTICDYLSSIGFTVSEKKTHITSLTNGFMFLGFWCRVTPSGKVLMALDSSNIKHERRKLKKMNDKVKSGEMRPEKFSECYGSWKAHVKHGNTNKLLHRTDQYVKQLQAKG